MAVTPASHSAGNYANGAASTIGDTTTSSIAAGRKVIALVSWYGGESLTSLSGGGLTWTVDVVSPGSGARAAIVSADAPAGLASGTTITATFSGGTFALGIGIASCDGLVTNAAGAVDDTDAAYTAPGVAAPFWSTSLTTTNANDVLIGGGFISFESSGVAPTSPASEIYEWAASNNTQQLIYREVSAAGTYTLGSSWTFQRESAAAAVAYKLAPVGTDYAAAGTVAAVSATTGTVAAHHAVAGTVAAVSGARGSASPTGAAVPPVTRTATVAAESRVVTVPAEYRTVGA